MFRRERDRLPTKQLTPSARPVDTYSQPAESPVAKPDYSGANQLEELAKALGLVNSKLGGWFDKEKKRMDAEAAAKGARLSLDNNRMNWNQFLDTLKDTDPERYEEMQGANPWVQKGFEEQHLKNLGMDYTDQLDIDMASNPVVGQTNDGRPIRLHDATDPGMVSAYMESHLKGYMQTQGLENIDDISMVENFLPSAREAQHGWVRRNAQERRAEAVEKRTAAMSTNATLQIGQMIKSGQLVQNPAQALTTLGTILGNNIREAYDGGVRDFDKLNEKTVEAVVAAAKLYEDPRILQVLDHIETSPGNKLGAIPRHNLTVQQTVKFLEDQKKEKVMWDERMKDIRRRNQMESITAPLIQRMMTAIKDPNASVADIDISDAIGKLTAQGMVTEAMQLNSWRQTLLNNEQNVPTNVRAYGEMQDRIQRGEATTLEIVAGTGNQWGEDVAKALIQNKQFYDRIREEKDESLYRVIRDTMQGGERLVKSSITGAEEFSAGMDKSVQQRGQEAIMRYRSDLQSMVEAFHEKEKRWPKAHEVSSMSDKLVQEISNNPLYRTANSSPNQYLTPEQQRGLEGQMPNAKPGETDIFRMPVDQLGQAVDNDFLLGASLADFRREVADYEATKRGRIAALAAFLGVTPEEVIKRQGTLYTKPVPTKQTERRR